ncbi:MAG: protein translocase subunit SecD, partial [Myxococcales bacterium]
LVIFFLCVGVLYALAAIGGTWKPRLGLDLEGGTRITLTAEGSPDATKMAQATSIIDSRVNGTGVTEAEVSTQGGRNIVVEIPGKNSSNLVDSVKRTAQLRFRVVANCPQLTGGPCMADTRAKAEPSASASPSGSPSASPSGKATPSKGATATPSAKASASPKSRPAPAIDQPMATTTPTPSPSKPATSPSTPAASSSATPKAPASGKTDALKWSLNPNQEWQTRFALAKCNDEDQALVPTNLQKPEKFEPVKDVPSEPLIACDENGVKSLLSPTLIEGTELSSADYGQPQNSTKWAVMLRFKKEATKVFGDLSRQMVPGSGSPYENGQFAIVLDGKTLSVAGFEGVILDGNAQITGDFTQGEANSLANSLKYGALPVKFSDDPSTQVVGPSLAGNQLSTGIWAGVVGLIIVMLYCLVYYRGLGIVVIASLLVAGLITYAVVLLLAKSAGFTLTLPGIAGLIVGVGITADSFIVLFERIRDEMRDGKSMRVAVEAGWARARNTCLAADAVSLLAAVVLYIFAIGVVRGFAFALGVSTIIDVIVFFYFTKPMVSWLAKYKFFNSGHRFSGLSDETLGIDGTPNYAGGRA